MAVQNIKTASWTNSGRQKDRQKEKSLIGAQHSILEETENNYIVDNLVWEEEERKRREHKSLVMKHLLDSNEKEKEGGVEEKQKLITWILRQIFKSLLCQKTYCSAWASLPAQFKSWPTAEQYIHCGIHQGF